MKLRFKERILILLRKYGRNGRKKRAIRIKRRYLLIILTIV